MKLFTHYDTDLCEYIDQTARFYIDDICIMEIKEINALYMVSDSVVIDGNIYDIMRIIHYPSVNKLDIILEYIE